MFDGLRVHTIYSSCTAIRQAAGIVDDGPVQGDELSGRSGIALHLHRGSRRDVRDVVRTIRDLHAAVNALEPDDALDAARSALRACPFVIGIARAHDGRDVVFSVARDVERDGYTTLATIGSDVARMRAYQRLPLEDRVANAHTIARAYATFERLRFVHGALGGEHVHVRTQAAVPGSDKADDPFAVVTQFDGGVVGSSSRAGRVRERSQLAALLHRAVFGIAPSAPDAVAAEMAQLPEATADALRTAWHSTLTGRQWCDVFAAAGHSPEFRELAVDRRAVVLGETVVVRWHAVPARAVFLDGVPEPQPAAGEARIVINTTGPLRLRAVSAFGETEAWTPIVRAFTPPTIATVSIPRLPQVVVHAPTVVAALPVIDIGAGALADAMTAAVRQRLTVVMPTRQPDSAVS